MPQRSWIEAPAGRLERCWGCCIVSIDLTATVVRENSRVTTVCSWPLVMERSADNTERGSSCIGGGVLFTDHGFWFSCGLLGD
jgi:hypothetical protein